MTSVHPLARRSVVLVVLLLLVQLLIFPLVWVVM
jgi:hypothetical protein